MQKPQTPRGKANIHCKPHCLYKQIKHNEQLYHLEQFLIQRKIFSSVENCLPVKFPDACQQPTLKTGLSKDRSLRLDILLITVFDIKDSAKTDIYLAGGGCKNWYNLFEK